MVLIQVTSVVEIVLKQVVTLEYDQIKHFAALEPAASKIPQRAGTLAQINVE
jgi:hypothetical protein